MKITETEYKEYYGHPTKELRDKLIISNIGLVKELAGNYAFTSRKINIEEVEKQNVDEFSDPTYIEATYHTIQESLKETISKMRITDQEIINRRYGLNGNMVQTAEEISQMYHIDKKIIQKKEKAALKRLRQQLNGEGRQMLEFFDENEVKPSAIQKAKK